MKIFLLILFGFVLNTGLRTYHSYVWWSTEATVSNEEYNKEFTPEHPTKAIDSKLGWKDNIKYLIAYPDYTFQKWEWRY